MTIFLHSCRATLRGLLLPCAGTLLLCAVILQALPHDATLGPDRSAGYWLHLPAMLLSAAALATVLEHWPLFSRGRPGCGWLQRLENRHLDGCGVAGLGSLTALAVVLAGTGVCFALLLGALGRDPGPVRAPLRFTLEAGHAFLAPQTPTLRFRATQGGAAVRALHLRPLAHAGGSMRAVQIQVRADGQLLHDGWIENLGEAIDLLLTPPRVVAEVEVRRRPAPGLVLRIADDDVEGEPVATRSGLLNGLLAALSYLLPAALSLAILALGHAHLALPVNLAAGLCALLLCTLTELTPNGAWITEFARGRFIAAGPAIAAPLPALAVTAAILLAGLGLGAVARRGGGGARGGGAVAGRGGGAVAGRGGGAGGASPSPGPRPGADR